LTITTDITNNTIAHALNFKFYRSGNTKIHANCNSAICTIKPSRIILRPLILKPIFLLTITTTFGAHVSFVFLSLADRNHALPVVDRVRMIPVLIKMHCTCSDNDTDTENRLHDYLGLLKLHGSKVAFLHSVLCRPGSNIPLNLSIIQTFIKYILRYLPEKVTYYSFKKADKNAVKHECDQDVQCHVFR
jgi:hypothetical protein